MKRIIFIFFIVMSSFFISSCTGQNVVENKNQVIYYNEVGEVGEDMPVTRLDSASSIALLFDDYDIIKNMDKTADFTDVDANSEEYIFVNYVFSKGIMVGQGDKFMPDEPLTIIQAQSLLDLINKDNKIKIKMSDDIKDKPISRSLWNTLLFQVGENKGCIENELKLFDFSSDKNVYYTDKGEFRYAGVFDNVFVGNTVKVFTRGNNIIGFFEVLKNSVDFENIFVKKVDDKKVSVNIFSRERIFDYSIEKDVCADISIKGNDIEISVIEKHSDDKVKLVCDDFIETEKLGRIEYANNFTVYRNNGVLSEKTELLCAKGECEIYLKDGKVSSIWFEKEKKPNTIRVVLSDNNIDGYIQNNIELRSSTGFKLIYGENEKDFLPAERFSLDEGNSPNYFGENCRIYIKPFDNGKIEISSLSKAKTMPEYRGVIEIEKRSGGGFVIVNELDFEEYLFSVVPCEMPVSFGEEALMVQSVTARSYGYNQFFLNRFCEYGANIDDTVNSQVYNNMGEYEESTKAVKETEDMFITYDNIVIGANYFSTSFGFTANSGETWADISTKSFPSETKPYLVSKPQFEEKGLDSLETEDKFREFLNMDIDCYDKNSPWYRWSVDMTGTELSQAVKNSFENLFYNSPAMMEYSKDGQNFENSGAKNIGRIKNISVEKRGSGGNIMVMLIEGESGFFRVSGEYNIRKILPPKSFIGGSDVELKCKNGLSFKNLSIMPSGFFTFDFTKDSFGFIESIHFYGGGNGHGVGMSQNGVKGMAEKGYSFEEILKHYFEGIEVSVIK